MQTFIVFRGVTGQCLLPSVRLIYCSVQSKRFGVCKRNEFTSLIDTMVYLQILELNGPSSFAKQCRCTVGEAFVVASKFAPSLFGTVQWDDQRVCAKGRSKFWEILLSKTRTAYFSQFGRQFAQATFENE